ncbi:MAG TPA: hypothetical protein VNX02_08835 [Steroidobacteraceae bacterium]|jgi:hypothetical protein|nr:hypothetical protein [Steroidobacteraceae bacterium]
MIPLRPIIRRILKWVGITLGSLVLLALVLFGIAYAINVRDEPLAPRTVALRCPPANPLRPEENLYIAMAGFGAPAGESVVRAGLARIDRYNRQVDAVMRDPLAIPNDSPGAGSLQFKGAFEFPRIGQSYWTLIPPHRQDVERLLDNNRELYTRYLALHQLRGYFQTARPSVSVPLVYAPTEVRQLFLASVVLRMRADDPRGARQALVELEDDVQLWRVMLAADGTFLSKMLAIAYLHADEQLLADAIADARASIPLGADDAPAVAPLFPLDDWNIGGAYPGEFLVQLTILEQMSNAYRSGWTPPDEAASGRWLRRVSERLEMQFFQVNATENLFAGQMDRLSRAAAPAAPPPAPYDPFSTIRFVYNPVGKTLAAIAVPGYPGYALRAWDGAAFQRLVRLSYEIRNRQIDATGIPAFMNEHPEWSTHPQDGRPFLWDSAARMIRVQTLGKDSSGRAYFVHVWQPAPQG